MFFRHLTVFRFPSSLVWKDLDTLLQDAALKPIGPLELSCSGFVPPLGGNSEALSHSVGDATWISLGGEHRVLPPAVLNEKLSKKLAEIEAREGHSPSSRARKRIKDDLLLQLIPQAFVLPTRIDAYLDLGHCFIAVNTPSRRAAEQLVSHLRRALGSFPALPLNSEVAPRSVLTGWIAGEPLPEGLSLGDECELRDALDGGAVVRCSNQEMQSDEIAKHLEAGKQVTRLALVLDDRLSFVFGDDLTVRKLKFLDGAVESLEQLEHEDLRAELDARFALMTGELSRLFGVLEKAFRLSAAT